MTLTKSLKLTDDDDLDISSGGLQMIEGVDGLVQRVRTRLTTFRGEIFNSPGTGVPWLTQVFSGGIPTVSTLNAAIFSALETVDGIKEIRKIEYSFTKETRSLRIDLDILDETGATVNVTLESIV